MKEEKIKNLLDLNSDQAKVYVFTTKASQGKKKNEDTRARLYTIFNTLNCVLREVK